MKIIKYIEKNKDPIGNTMIVIGIFMFLFLIFLPYVSAEIQTLGTFKAGENVNLIQTCENCTSNNITSVLYPNSSIIISNVQMTRDGTFYNYSLSEAYTNDIGQYIVNGVGNLNGISTVWSYDFDVTPSGFVNNIGFQFFILILSAGIIILGFWIGDGWITIFGTLGLYFFGLYTLYYGFSGIKDAILTEPYAFIILGLAGYISIKSAMEMLDS